MQNTNSKKRREKIAAHTCFHIKLFSYASRVLIDVWKEDQSYRSQRTCHFLIARVRINRLCRVTYVISPTVFQYPLIQNMTVSVNVAIRSLSVH